MVPKMVAIYRAYYFLEWPKGPKLLIPSFLPSPCFSVQKGKDRQQVRKLHLVLKPNAHLRDYK